MSSAPLPPPEGSPAEPLRLKVEDPPANPEVVAMLRAALERAERGEVLGIALAMELTGREVGTVFTATDLFRLLGATALVHARILDRARP